MSTEDARWGALKASTSPQLSQVEIEALPVGMLVFVGADNGPGLVTGPGRCRFWTEHGWGQVDDVVGVSHRVFLPRLPRLSFVLTVDAVRERQKTVTRRLALPSWWKDGAWFLGVDRIRRAGAQGLCIGRCGPANNEPLVAISQSEVDREGFPHTTPEGFCAMFRRTVPREWDGWVWRLPFTYLEIPT